VLARAAFYDDGWMDGWLHGAVELGLGLVLDDTCA